MAMRMTTPSTTAQLWQAEFRPAKHAYLWQATGIVIRRPCFWIDAVQNRRSWSVNLQACKRRQQFSEAACVAPTRKEQARSCSCMQSIGKPHEQDIRAL